MAWTSRRSLVVACALVSIAGAARLAQDGDTQVLPIAGTVSMIVMPGGGNIGLCSGDDGLVVVDNHLESRREAVLVALRAASAAPPRFLLNTHWHGDHTGNNEPLGAERVPIVAHDAVRRRLAGDATLGGRTAEATPRAALPTVTYKDALELHLNGERIELRHFGPGHTDGDTIVFFHGSKVVHLGDQCFHPRFPFIDVGSGGSPKGYIATLDAVLAAIGDDWRFIPGHGSSGTKADLARYRDGLADCIARVERALAAGQTVEQMLAADLLGEYKAWSWQFITTERFIGDLATALPAPGGGR